MSLKDNLKKSFSLLYEYYMHFVRIYKISKINRIKKMSLEKQMELISEEYECKIGHKLNWNNLKTYTEKMQWEKLLNNDSRKTIYSDKLLVRDWIKEMIGEDVLIPLLGVWNSFDEINFDLLPSSFVLKTNHGSGTNIIVNDISTFNKKIAKLKFDDWMKMDFGYTNSIQIHYSSIVPKILAEEFVASDDGDLRDYKFLCFDGKAYFCWVDCNRFSNHTRTVFDISWNKQPWTQSNYGISSKDIPKPDNFEIMVEYAEILSKGFKQVRVDFYNVNGKIYFGEMTFTNGSGLDQIVPLEFDDVLGSYWHITGESDAK